MKAFDTILISVYNCLWLILPHSNKLILIKSMYHEKKVFFLETNTAVIPLLYVFSL